MLFLIGVIIFIVFIIGLLFYFKMKIKSFFQSFGFPSSSISEFIKAARLEDEDVPKSLSSMDTLYLSQIQKDFVGLNVDELKRKAEDILLNCYLAFEKKDSKMLDGKIKSFVDQMIEDYKDQNVHFKDLVIHKTVISNYKKEKGTASIFFSSSYQYIKVSNGDDELDDEAIILLDNEIENGDFSSESEDDVIDEIDEDEEELVKEVPTTFSIHCPNCGSPIRSLGEKRCSYCGSLVKELYSKTFICCDIKRY